MTREQKLEVHLDRIMWQILPEGTSQNARETLAMLAKATPEQKLAAYNRALTNNPRLLDEERHVMLQNFRQNSVDHPRLKPNLVYAELVDVDNGDLLIGATLDYIADAIAKRGYRLVRVRGQAVTQKMA